MANNQNPFYSKLYKNWQEAYPYKPGKAIQDAVNAFWNIQKTNEAAVKSKIQELEAKKENTPLIEWMKGSKEKTTKHTDVIAIAGPSRTQPNPESDASKRPSKGSNETADVTQSNRESIESKCSDETTEVQDKTRNSTPFAAQDRNHNKIVDTNQAIARVEVHKQSGLSTTKDRQKLRALIKEKEKFESTLKRQISIEKNYTDYLANKKVKLAEVTEVFPELKDVLQESSETRSTPGKFCIEEKYPLLLTTIVDIVAPEGSADLERSSDLLRSCTTLKDLK